MHQRNMFREEYLGKVIVTIGGVFVILLTVAIGLFLIIKGIPTFTQFGHSIAEFLFSSDFKPNDSAVGENGTIGSAVFIVGSLATCGLALLIATPFSIGASIFMTEIAPNFGDKVFKPAVEIFVGIPSIVYGWTGLVVLVPIIRNVFELPYGNTVLTAGIILAIMIFPTITSVATDAILAVPKEFRSAAYGLGSTRWQVIRKIVIPAARPGIMTGMILGLARAFGEALAVAMVIGKTKIFPENIFSSTSTLTTIIASNMGNTFDGTEYNSVLWTMALLLFVISLFFIVIIHYISAKGAKKASGQD